MKFADTVRRSLADLPDTEDLFASYKALKKSLKRMAPEDGAHADAAGAPPSAQALEAAFLQAISADVNHLNDSYIEREEVAVIRFGEVAAAAAAAAAPGAPPGAAAAARAAAADLHGELLLLLHWSCLAYTGLVKILKKHHKRTGMPLAAPHLRNLLSQPFCSVGVARDLAARAEALASGGGAAAAGCAAAPAGAGGGTATAGTRRAAAALAVWEELAANAHTPSTVLSGAAAAAVHA
jgi:hypothetical protein